MPDAPRCGANKSRGRGECRGWCLKRPDGTYTQRCKFHGGTKQLLEPGDPRRGGRPPTTFRYSTFMRTDEDRELYESARGALGSLDEELNLARTNLERFRRSRDEQAKGGIPLSVSDGGKSVSVRPYAQIEAEYLDLIRRLEEGRKKLLSSGVPDNDDSETYREWIATARKPSDDSSSGSSSAPASEP